MAIAISQAIADVGLCFVLQLRLSLTLRVPHSPLSSHICPIILSAAPMGALLYARVPNDEVECLTIGWAGVPYYGVGCPTTSAAAKHRISPPGHCLLRVLQILGWRN